MSSLIEQRQKIQLFSEAAKKGITTTEIMSLSDIYSKLIGTSDIGRQIYGKPMAPVYLAKPGELIDVPKIRKFFTGLYRDYIVLDNSITELDNFLVLLNIEYWTRGQLIQNRAKAVEKTATTEKIRVSSGSRWAYSESFTSTSNLDMVNTTAWIDTAEGTAFLPNLGEESIIAQKDIKIIESSPPTNGSFINSIPDYAFDTLESTIWRASFSDNDSEASVTIEVPTQSISAISFDPVGYGIQIRVEVQDGSGFREVLRSFIFNKKTFSLELKSVSRIKLSFSTAEGSVPNVGGLRTVNFFTSTTNRQASVYTNSIKPALTFNELRVDSVLRAPDNADIILYYTTSSGGLWTKIQSGVWNALSDSFTLDKTISSTTTMNFDSGLFKVPLTKQAINNIDGTLSVGSNQIEVSAFRRDWSGTSESPKQLSPTNFETEVLLKTWTSIINYSSSTFTTYPRLLDVYGGSTLTSSPFFITRGRNVVLQRKLDDQDYKEMCFVPFVGSYANNTLQPLYNYRFRFYVYCTQESFFDSAKYWFLQGFRAPNVPTYREIGKSYGAFSLYINNDLVAGDSLPYTIFSDNSLEQGGDLGKPYSFKLVEGWNTIEIFINLQDPTRLLKDYNDNGDPYVQINLMPSFFDPEFQIAANITKIVGSGDTKAVSDFDLLWNLPKDPSFWAWSDDRLSVAFNSNSVKPIDGFLLGTYPKSILHYKSVEFDQDVSELYLRADLERDASSISGPILDELKVFVR